MQTVELFEDEDDRLSGYLDVRGLAQLLGVDLARFTDAMDKLKLGQRNDLTIPEITELANAFANLLGMDSPRKSMLIGRLMSVKAVSVQATPNQTQTT